MSHIFVSYSHEDRELASQIVRQMEVAGLDVWVDYQSIPPGADWELEISQGIRGCDALVLVQTPRSEVSARVKKEWLYAEHLKKSIYPLLCEGDLWFSFVDVQFTDLRQGIDAPLARLIATLPRSAAPDTLNTQTAASISLLEEKFKHKAVLNNVAFSRFGHLVGVVGGHGLVGVWATNGIRDNANSEEWFPTEFGYETKALAFSLDGRLLAVATRNQPQSAGIKLFDLNNWREIQTLRDSSDVAHLSFTPDNARLIAVESGLTPRILIYEADSGRKQGFRLAYNLQPDVKGKIRALAVSPDNDVFVTAGRVSTGIGIQLWSLLDGSSFEDVGFENNQTAVTAVTFSADGKYLYMATLAGTIFQWDRATGESVEPPIEIGRPIYSIAVNTRGDLLAVGQDMSDSYAKVRSSGLEHDGVAQIQLWGVKQRALLQTLAQHTATVTSLAFAPDDKHLASTGLDKRLYLWGLLPDQNNGRRTPRSSR